MNEIAKALEALDRIFNYCEEIDLHLPKEEQTGYDMLVDINIIRKALVNQKSIVEELEKIKTRINHRANEHIDGDYYVCIKDINEVFDEYIN